MQEIASYRNGNYTTKLFNDGTKIRILDDGEKNFDADFPENIDIKISNKCYIGCEFCHEKSDKYGDVVDLDSYAIRNFIGTLKPGTELAIGGGGLSFLGQCLWDFLREVNNQQVIANITVNALEIKNSDEFFYSLFRHIKTNHTNNRIGDYKLFRFLKLHPEIFYAIEGSRREELINGVGISYHSNSVCKQRMKELNNAFPSNIVIHTIYGVTTKDDYDWLVENGFKILVLGYKNFGRGAKYLEKNEESINRNMKDFDDNLDFYLNNAKYISFDCLATEQIKLKDKISPSTWETRYMGNDGNFTMYVDLTKMKFGTSSTTPENKRHNMGAYSYNASLMFKSIKNKNI